MGFWKGLGKGLLKVAPIATAFIPGVGPLASMAIGAGTGAASGAVSGGGKGALIGGLMGAGTGALGGAAKAGKLGNFGKSAVGKTLINAGTNLAGGNGSNSVNTGGGLMQRLLSGDVLDAAGRGVGSIAATEAHNRGTKLDAEMAADEMKSRIDQANRDAAKEGMREMQIASYLANGGANYGENPILHSGLQATKFDFGTRPASDAEKAYGSKMQTMLQDRLDHPLTTSDYTKLMDPGKMERTMDWLGPILTTVGAARGAGKYVPPYNAPQQLPPPTTQALPPVEFNMPVTKARNPYDVEF